MSNTCGKCGLEFSSSRIIDGKLRILNKRKFCLDCSPFGRHNTSKYLTYQDSFQKQCPCCKSLLPFSSFKKRANGRLASWCSDCGNSRAIIRLKERKQTAVDYKGGKCQVCGYSKCLAALEFHHCDMDDKEFSIGLKRHRTFDNLKVELDKCELLCANCHREKHNKP